MHSLEYGSFKVTPTACGDNDGKGHIYKLPHVRGTCVGSAGGLGLCP